MSFLFCFLSLSLSLTHSLTLPPSPSPRPLSLFPGNYLTPPPPPPPPAPPSDLLRQNQKNPEALYYRALCLYYSGNHPQAIAHAQEALRNDPDFVDARYVLVFSFTHLFMHSLTLPPPLSPPSLPQKTELS